MQETWVRSLIWEDPTCQRAPKPVRHDSWAYALEPGSQNFWACESQNLCSQQVKPLHWETFTPQLKSNPHSPQLRKTYVWQWRPSMTKTKSINKTFKKKEITPQIQINKALHRLSQLRASLLHHVNPSRYARPWETVLIQAGVPHWVFHSQVYSWNGWTEVSSGNVLCQEAKLFLLQWSCHSC